MKTSDRPNGGNGSETAGYLMGEVTAHAAPHSGHLNRQDLADQAMASRRISPVGAWAPFIQRSFFLCFH